MKNIYPHLISCFLILSLFSKSFAQKEISNFRDVSKNGHIVNCLAISPDSKIIASGGTDGNIILWSIKDLKEIRTLKGHISGIEDLEFDQENGYLYSVSRDKRLILWDVEKGKIHFDIKAHEREVNRLQIDYFRGNVITASSDKTISLWDKSTGEHQKTFYGHERDVTSISISSDWKFLYSSGADLLMKTWDLNNGDELKSLNLGNSWIKSISNSSNNNVFAAGGDNRVITIWNDEVYDPIRNIEGQKGAITALSISGNGQLLASGSYDKSIVIYNIETGVSIAELKKHKAAITDVVFSNDGNYLVTSELGQTIRISEIHDLNAGKFEIEIPTKKSKSAVAASSNNSTSNDGFDDNVSFNPLEQGENHLLLIAINDYDHWPRLNNALNDASDVQSILTKKYQFRDENVYTVKNDQATLENIHNAFQDLRSKIGEKDNLLIFYSGHGFYDKDLDEGYWIPVDAEAGKTTDYLPNSNLLKYIKALDSKHIFLVADACFSGSLFSPSTRGYVENVEKYKSRWALTSGRLEFVSDGNMGARNSPFTSYFLKFLNSNEKDQVPVSELIQYVKVSVSNNSDQTPIGSPLKNVGDEGGEFIFKKNE